MGHCSSYDEMQAIDTSAALEVLAKANEFGTVIPSNISPGPFIQIAADNNDLNEETLDGKNTTHATTMVVYQRKAFGPDLPPAPLVDHTTKRRSLQSTSSIYDIQECLSGPNLHLHAQHIFTVPRIIIQCLLMFILSTGLTRDRKP